MGLTFHLKVSMSKLRNSPFQRVESDHGILLCPGEHGDEPPQHGGGQQVGWDWSILCCDWSVVSILSFDWSAGHNTHL